MDNVSSKSVSRAFSQAARWQIIVTAIISCISLMLAGVNAAISAFIGGASVIIGSAVGMMMARRPSAGTAGAVLIGLLKAEVIKVMVIALLLLVAFKNYQGLVPLSLIGGLAGAALAAGAGLRAMNNEN